MHVLHTVKKRGWSGETNSLLMLAAGQAARGHRVTVAAGATSATAQRARAAGLPVLEISFDRPVHRLPIIPGSRALAAYITDQPVDVVHCHASFDHWVMARLLRRRDAVLVRSKRNRKHISRHKLNRWLYTKGTDATVAISSAVQQDLLDTGFFPTGMLVIGNGIDLSRGQELDRNACRRGFEFDGPTLMYVGRISERKRVDRVLDAARILRSSIPRLGTVVVGTGDEALIRDLRARYDRDGVRFLGHRDDVPQLLTASDVLCYAPRDEAFGLVPLEAMACRCPVVLSDEPGFRQYAVHEQNALLVPDGNPHGLAEAIRRVLNDPSLGERLRAGGWQTAVRFSVDRTVDRYLQLYDELLRNQAAGRPRASSHKCSDSADASE